MKNSQVYDFPIEYVRQLRITCDKIGIRSTPNFWTATPKRLADAFNTMTFECWCPKFPKLVSKLLEPFFVAALQHDWETCQKEKSWGMFTDANLRFIYNAFQEAVYAKNYKMILMGFVLAFLCQFFGYKTYLKISIPDLQDKT